MPVWASAVVDAIQIVGRIQINQVQIWWDHRYAFANVSTTSSSPHQCEKI